MAKSKRLLRRAVLASLFDHLQEQYGIEWSREAFVDSQLSLPQIDAILAFKSDPRLDELRGALGRLESGTYGICIGCKRAISGETLGVDPARRFCPACEQRVSQRRIPEYGMHARVAG